MLFICIIIIENVVLILLLLRELREGVSLIDENGNNVGQSTVAAKKGIFSVCISRILMASPGMG